MVKDVLKDPKASLERIRVKYKSFRPKNRLTEQLRDFWLNFEKIGPWRSSNIEASE